MKKFLFFLTVLTALSSMNSQVDSTKATTFSGSVDGYYRWSANGGSSLNNVTSFTNSSNSFELGMAQIRADHSFGKVSATVELGWGRRSEEFSYNEYNYGNETLAMINQAYLTYSPTEKIKLTAGKFGTHIGYEVLNTYSNRNYSMSYMFSYGPFFHTGLKADISLGGKSAFMVGIANLTDFTTSDSSTKVGIAQFSTATTDSKWKFFLNYQGYGGVSTPEMINPGYALYKSLNQFDLVVNGSLSDKFSVGLNSTIQSVKLAGDSSSWWGTALYFNYDPSSKFGLTFRGEYFGDKDGLKLGYTDPVTTDFTGVNMLSLTLSGNYKVGPLTIIPEIRLDNSSEDYFYNSSDNGTSSAFSTLIAAVYKF